MSRLVMALRVDIETLYSSIQTILRIVGRVLPDLADRISVAIANALQRLPPNAHRSLLHHVIVQMGRISRGEDVVLRLNALEMLVITLQRAALWFHSPLVKLRFEIFLNNSVRMGLDFIGDGVMIFTIKALFFTLSARGLWILIKHRREFRIAYRKFFDKNSGTYFQRRLALHRDTRNLGLSKKESLALVGIFAGTFIAQGGVIFSR